MSLRVTRVQADVAGAQTDGNLRISRVQAAVAGAVDRPAIRVVRLAAQVLLERDGTQNVSATQGLVFGHTSALAFSYPVSESHGLQFSQSVSKLLLKASATLPSESHGLVFSQQANLPKNVASVQGLQFSDTADGFLNRQIEQGLQFGQIVALNRTLSPSETHGLQFGQAFLIEHGTPDLCNYAPLVGGGGAAIPPTSPPSLSASSTVTLFYPTVSPTQSVTLRAPEIGDRDRLQFDRIERESRGGTLEVFRDPNWPKQIIFAVQITGLKETTLQTYLTFVQNTLGQEIGFTDWEGRSWRGFLLTSAATGTRTRDDIIDVDFEFVAEALL